MKLKDLLRFFAFVIVMTGIIFPPKASAYGDLTTAAYSSQLILGAVMGGFLTVRMLPSLATDFFKSLLKRQ